MGRGGCPDRAAAALDRTPGTAAEGGVKAMADYVRGKASRIG